MKHKKRQALTLVEMMLVIVLIGVVGGALAFNLRGALDQGKGFKTQETQKKITAILNIAAIDKEEQEILDTWQTMVCESPLIKIKTDGHNALPDAWGNPFTLQYDDDQEQFCVTTVRIDLDGNILPKG